MLTTEYLDQKLHQIIYDAFIEGGEAALSTGKIPEHLFAYSNAKKDMIRLIVESITSDDD